MGLGSIMVGVAVLIVLVAFVASPFRSSGQDVDGLIERWVADARKPARRPSEDHARPVARRDSDVDDAPDDDVRDEDDAIPVIPVAADGAAGHFCHNCGRRVKPEYRFCRNCGARLV